MNRTRKAPRTVAQFRNRLAVIGACPGGLNETEGKTLARAWRETTNPGYMMFWLRAAMRVSGVRLDRIFSRAIGTSNPCDYIRKHINYDGGSMSYQAAKARLGRSKRRARL